jgi:hypothetical protein
MGQVDVYIRIFLTSALVRGERSASRPGRFIPGERAHGTHWIGGWVDPTASLDDLEKRKLLVLPRLELRPLDRPTRASCYTDCAMPALRACHKYNKQVDFITNIIHHG